MRISELETPFLWRAGTLRRPQTAFRQRDFGNYRLIELLAHGGMGMVYRARQKGLDREVALKVLLTGEDATREEVKRFLNEARAAARLSHPYIVPIYEVGEAAGKYFFTMDLVRGQSLDALLDAEKLPIKWSLSLVRKVCLAVHYAHNQGIIHRDIKPGNILIDPSGDPHLTDFGLAKSVHPDPNLSFTTPGTVLGTPNYMSPEQARGDSATVQSDVYSLGAVLYHLLTGRPPFQGKTPVDLIRRIAEDDPVPPRQRNQKIHRDIETITLKALAKDPRQRYASAMAMAEDLTRYVNGEAILARPESGVERVFRRYRRNPLPFLLSTLLLAILSIILYREVDAHWQAAEDRSKLLGEAEACIEKVEGSWTQLASPDAFRRAHLELEDALRQARSLATEDRTRLKARIAELRDRLDEAEAAWRARVQLALEAEARRQERLWQDNARQVEAHWRLFAGSSLLAYAERVSDGDLEEAVRSFSEAERRFAAVLQEFPDHEGARQRKFAALLGAGELVGFHGEFLWAREKLTEALDLGLDSALVYSRLASLDARKETDEEYSSKVANGRDNLEEGQYAIAIDYFKNALEFLERTHQGASEDARRLRKLLREAQYGLLKGEADDLQRELLAAGTRHAPGGGLSGLVPSVGLPRRLLEVERYPELIVALERAARLAEGEELSELQRRREQVRRLQFEALHAAVVDAIEGRLWAEARLHLAEIPRFGEPDERTERLRAQITSLEASPEDMAYMPRVRVELGSSFPQDNNPLQPVVVDTFLIDRFEVTNREYLAFIEAGGYERLSYWPLAFFYGEEVDESALPPHLRLSDEAKLKRLRGLRTQHVYPDDVVDDLGAVGPAIWLESACPLEGCGLCEGVELDHPVRGVSFFEAQAYANFVEKRLPTEDEWELAARWDEVAGELRTYPWGEELSLEHGRFQTDGPTLWSFQRDCSPSGCWHMGGNVSEWTLGSRELVVDGLQLSAPGQAVLRGGSFATRDPARARPAARQSSSDPFYRSRFVGFRCAQDPR